MSTDRDARPLRVFIAGEGRSPIHEEAWQRGLEAANCVVERFDWLPRFRSRSRLWGLALRAQDHFSAGPTILALNSELVGRVLAGRPDVLILYRPTHVLSSALRLIQQKSPSTLIVSYNNDDPFSPGAPAYRWFHYLDCLPVVDVALAYRKKNLPELKAAGARRVELMRSYFIPYLDAPVTLTSEDHQRYDSDVVFVGHYEPDGRVEALAAVAERFPGFRLYGPDWDRAPDHSALRRFRPIRPLPHAEYVKAIQCAKIALVFFSTLNNDSYTRRVFEIPAIGTFMLSQRTTEMAQMFRPGLEADYFGSTAELLEKIEQYLHDGEARLRVGQGGAANVREQGHDVFSRMRVLSSDLRAWRAEKQNAKATNVISHSDTRTERNATVAVRGADPGPFPTESGIMTVFRRLGRDDLAWTLRRLYVPVSANGLVLEVGSGGNPFPRSNVLLDAYEVTRERHYQPLVADRPTVLGLVEDMPFRDDAFDFVIACHVIEHSIDIAACIRELQRVAIAGYIECPDAFFERINPYMDHRYEVTVRDGALVTRRKSSWIQDAELVELYERQLKPSKEWRRQLRNNPFALHVRYYWSRSSGGIKHIDLSPKAGGNAEPFEEGDVVPPNQPASTLRGESRAAIRRLVSQTSRNQALNWVDLLRCVQCHANLRRDRSDVVCDSCGRRYPATPMPRMFRDD